MSPPWKKLGHNVTKMLDQNKTKMLFFSKTLKTGIQYLPIDSIQTTIQLYLASPRHNSCTPLVKEEKWACLYSICLKESVMPIQA